MPRSPTYCKLWSWQGKFKQSGVRRPDGHRLFTASLRNSGEISIRKNHSTVKNNDHNWHIYNWHLLDTDITG